MLHQELIFGRGVHHSYLQVAECITPRQRQPGRQDVNMYIFLLNPAFGKPAGVLLRIFAQFPKVLRKLQFQESRCIRMAAGIGELQCNMPHQMLPEVQADILTLSHGNVRQLMQHKVIFFRAVPLLQFKSADRLLDCMVQNRLQFLCPGQQAGISCRIKIRNDRNQCHLKNPL